VICENAELVEPGFGSGVQNGSFLLLTLHCIIRGFSLSTKSEITPGLSFFVAV